MPWLKIPKWWRLLTVLALVLWPAASAAGEFSAQTLTRERSAKVLGRIFVKDGKMRQEFSDAEGRTITIMRPDKKVIWVILPWSRIYMELPLKASWPGQFLQIPPNARAKRLVGNERLSGYDTQKYEVSVPARGGLEKQTFWVAAKLGMPIKVVVSSRQFSMEYQNIRERKLPDRLFELPPGCKKSSKPALEP
jgi:outer membrane lipoprotein-sorting protein